MTSSPNRYENWEATIGYPPTYDWEPCKYESERGHVESMASMAELDQRGHFLQLIVSKDEVISPEHPHSITPTLTHPHTSENLYQHN